MLKVLFALVITSSNGGINADLAFPTLHQCEAAKEQVEALRQGPIRAVCIEQQVKSKKLKCSIENKTDYKNPRNDSRAKNMDGYPYPVGFTCVEE